MFKPRGNTAGSQKTHHPHIAVDDKRLLKIQRHGCVNIAFSFYRNCDRSASGWSNSSLIYGDNVQIICKCIYNIHMHVSSYYLYSTLYISNVNIDLLFDTICSENDTLFQEKKKTTLFVFES
jgi:hypothetical protein